MNVYTTGQIARRYQVATRTVSKWFDSGSLQGYRIPGSPDRRIPREYLIKFLKEHDMPLGDLEKPSAKVLVVSNDPNLIEKLTQELEATSSFELQVTPGGFAAGLQVASFHPHCIVVDFAIGYLAASHICQNLRQRASRPHVVVIALRPIKKNRQKIDRSNITAIFKQPVDAALLAERLRTLLKIHL